MDSFNELMY